MVAGLSLASFAEETYTPGARDPVMLGGLLIGRWLVSRRKTDPEMVNSAEKNAPARERKHRECGGEARGDVVTARAPPPPLFLSR